MNWNSRFLFVVNEFTAPLLLLAMALKRRACVLCVHSVIPRNDALLTRLVAWAVRTRRVCHAFELSPETAQYRDIMFLPYHDDAFARMEPWIEVHFGFDAADDMLTEDARPYKHITCNMMARLFVPLYLLWTARRREEVRGAILVGAPQHLVDAYVHLFGEQPTVASRWDVVPNRLVNPIILSMCALAVLVAGARRLRPLASVRHMTLGADFINDPRDIPIWTAIAGSAERVLVVLRNRVQERNLDSTWRNYPLCRADDGWFPVFVGLGAIARSLRELGPLARLMPRLSPTHFLQVALIPVRRLRVRGILQRFRFQYFWARDDYNVEHILRTQELRRRGAISLGVCHGMPVAAEIAPMMRHIDFDRYYIPGRHMLERYGAKWPDHMQVCPAGSLGLTPERSARLHESRGTGILYAVKPGRHVHLQIALVRLLSNAYADRTIYVKIKTNQTDFAQSRIFVTACAEAGRNVRLTDAWVYDLFLDCCYVVSDPSNVAGEAIQFGLPAIVFDVDDRATLFYRRFAGLCVADPQAVLDRFKAWDRGSATFDRKLYGELVPLSRLPFCSIVADDLNLSECERSSTESQEIPSPARGLQTGRGVK